MPYKVVASPLSLNIPMADGTDFSTRCYYDLELERRISDQARKLGQPSPASHPHLLKENEVVMGLTHNELRTRRKKLVDSLQDGEMVIVSAAPERIFSNDVK